MSSRCLLLIGRVELPHECRQQDLGHRSDTQTYHEALYVPVCPVMAHEFGHTAGLGHAVGWPGYQEVMTGYVPEHYCPLRGNQ